MPVDKISSVLQQNALLFGQLCQFVAGFSQRIFHFFAFGNVRHHPYQPGNNALLI